MSRWMEIGEKLVFLTEMDEDSVDADPEIWDPNLWNLIQESRMK